MARNEGPHAHGCTGKAPPTCRRNQPRRELCVEIAPRRRVRVGDAIDRLREEDAARISGIARRGAKASRGVVEVMKPIGFATALLALSGVSYAAASENWVCGIPTLVDPTRINLLDLDIVGDYLVVNSQRKGVNLRLPILHNDHHKIIFRWHEATTSDTIPVELGVIDKVLGSRPIRMVRLTVTSRD